MRVRVQGHYNVSPIPSDNPTKAYINSIDGAQFDEIIICDKFETLEDIKNILKRVYDIADVTIYRMLTPSNRIFALYHAKIGWMIYD